MGPTGVDLMVGIIDRIEARPLGPGRPPMSTAEVIEILERILDGDYPVTVLREHRGFTARP